MAMGNFSHVLEITTLFGSFPTNGPPLHPAFDHPGAEPGWLPSPCKLTSLRPKDSQMQLARTLGSKGPMTQDLTLAS